MQITCQHFATSDKYHLVAMSYATKTTENTGVAECENFKNLNF